MVKNSFLSPEGQRQPTLMSKVDSKGNEILYRLRYSYHWSMYYLSIHSQFNSSHN